MQGRLMIEEVFFNVQGHSLQDRLNEVLFDHDIYSSIDDISELVIYTEKYLDYLCRQVDEYEDIRVDIESLHNSMKPEIGLPYTATSDFNMINESMKDMAKAFMLTGVTIQEASDAMVAFGRQIGKVRTQTLMLDYMNVLK